MNYYQAVIASTARLTLQLRVTLSLRKPLSSVASVEQELDGGEWVLSALLQQGLG